MTGYTEWYAIKNLEQVAARHGMQVSISNMYDGRSLALTPAPGVECLPSLSKDVELASGSAEELYAFLYGWEKSRLYLDRLGLISEKSIKAAEQEILQGKTAQVLRGTTKV